MNPLLPRSEWEFSYRRRLKGQMLYNCYQLVGAARRHHLLQADSCPLKC